MRLRVSSAVQIAVRNGLRPGLDDRQHRSKLHERKGLRIKGRQAPRKGEVAP